MVLGFDACGSGDAGRDVGIVSDAYVFEIDLEGMVVNGSPVRNGDIIHGTYINKNLQLDSEIPSII